MKIGFDAKRAFNNCRGLGNYSRDTIRILSTQFPENRYTLFTTSAQQAVPFSWADNCRIVTPDTMFHRKFPSLWRTFSLAKLTDECRLDVFHGLSHELPYAIEKSRTRSIVTMHDLIFLKFPELYPFIDRQLYKAKYLYSCKIADHIIAVSEQTKRDLMELAKIPEKKITVVYQGCHPIFKKAVSAEQRESVRRRYRLPEQFMLTVGALEKRKNQLLILQAMLQKNVDSQLVMVGVKTKYAETLEKFIWSHRLQNRVNILTHVPLTDLPAIYHCASLFIYPSLFEGFGIPILEAMECNLPVIAASGSCLEESGGAGSLYVSPQYPEELAEKISNVLNDSELRDSMLQKNRKHLQRFSDETIARNLMEVYRQVML